MKIFAKITATGSYVPSKIVTNFDLSKEVGARVIGIVGRDGGYTATKADVCILIPTINNDAITPHAESMQAVIWHLMVSHPTLKQNKTKW